MEVIVDRFEKDFVVCEKSDNEMMNIRKEMLPEGVKKGDVLTIFGNQVTINNEMTKSHKEGMGDLKKNLWTNE